MCWQAQLKGPKHPREARTHNFPLPIALLFCILPNSLTDPSSLTGTSPGWGRGNFFMFRYSKSIIFLSPYLYQNVNRKISSLDFQGCVQLQKVWKSSRRRKFTKELTSPTRLSLTNAQTSLGAASLCFQAWAFYLLSVQYAVSLGVLIRLHKTPKAFCYNHRFLFYTLWSKESL